MRIRKWAKTALQAAWRGTSVANLIVTRRCDLACSYCTARGKSPDLAASDWIKIARRLSHRFSVFTVSGGEPLLYKGLTELMDALSQTGLAGLCTNARTLEEQHLEAMPGLDYLNFSIDHTGDSSHSPKDAFGKLEMMSHYARRHSFVLRGTAVITSRSVDSIDGIVRKLAAHDIPVNLQLVQNPGPADAFDTPEKLARLRRLQDEIVQLKQRGFDIDETGDYIRGFAPFIEKQAAVKCRAGSAYLAVDHDGRLMPCQSSAATGEPLHHDTTDVDAALRALPMAVPEQCRCWWNCYHRDAAWTKNPVAFAGQALIEQGQSNLRRLTMIRA